MIVRILSSSASFHGVSYNTGKIDQGLGELMKVSNFGVLHGLQELRPEDYKNELKAISALNKRVKSPQFHAAISAPGKSHDKYQLTAIAEQWLANMGYGKQPYLVVFHNDTANNHVHIVSTRIDRDGKKINRDFEHIRAVQSLNKVLGIDEKHSVTADIDKALAYRFHTIAQFKMVMENQGYVLKEAGDQLQVIKFGTKLADLDFASVTNNLSVQKPDSKRIAQVKAILTKYAGMYDGSLKPSTIPLPGRYGKPTGAYTSEMAQYLKEKHGLVLIFHASGDKPPYGYSLIDQSGKAVYKGSEIMPLKELLAIQPSENNKRDTEPIEKLVNPGKEIKDYYRALLKAVMNNYPGIRHGLHHQGFDIRHSSHGLVLIDYTANTAVPINELLNEKDYQDLKKEIAQSGEITAELQRQYHAIPAINLASDIDDEAIHGRNRQRKKKARTNTR
jgi:hypothetical protein